MALTDTACRNAKAVDKAFKLSDSAGLYLLVNPSGGKLWRFKYRFAGKEKLLALGSYPQIALKDARKRRDKARELLDDSIDPSQQKKISKLTQQAAAAHSFKAVAEAWHARWAPSRDATHAAKVRRRLEADIYPEIGTLPVSAITAPMLLAVAKKVEARGALDVAKRVYQTCGQVLRYALAHGLIERNPAADVKPGDALRPAKTKNYARLELKDVPELLRRIETYDGSVYTRLAIKLMALTFVRTSELIGARWEEFDFAAGQWRIPAERMKMDTPHIVPLSRQAVAVLRELEKVRLGRALLFPGERDHAKPMSNNTILYALYRMGYHSRMTGHGFRGLASTILHEQGFEHAHIELQLAHQERDAISAAYNYATYLPQRKKMMQWYADRLDQLLTSAAAPGAR
ncbi:tyrosine-type recombinase/integrase [Methylibium rhizosphaerae]|uniref:tyrosine-type recombinase/integrase n=1 Tax=Methylibium rhizosphaerae TaxID=2570323 RepID=UPI00112734AB|nr:integrase arm-type DNA-binding domain-containing protein [Methylibium rhizosphaerae]